MKAIGLNPEQIDARAAFVALAERGLFSQEELQALFVKLEEAGLSLTETASVLFVKADELGLFCEVSAEGLYNAIEELGLDVEDFAHYFGAEFMSLYAKINEQRLKHGVDTEFGQFSVKPSEVVVKVGEGVFQPQVHMVVGPDWDSLRRGKLADLVDVSIDSSLPVSELKFVVFPQQDLQFGKVSEPRKQEVQALQEQVTFGIWTVPLKPQALTHWRQRLPWTYQHKEGS